MKYVESGPRDKIFLLSIILVPICLVLLFIVPVIYGKISANYAQRHIPLMIEAVPGVSKAEIIGNDWLINSDFHIQILFENGGRLEVSGVNEWGKGEIEISEVGGYMVGPIDKRGISMLSATDMYNPAMKFWSAITGLQLESVMDLVKNYQAIYSVVEACPDISDYTFENYDTPSFREMSREDKRKAMEKAHEIMVKTHPATSRATVEGEEYFLTKFPLSLIEAGKIDD